MMKTPLALFQMFLIQVMTVQLGYSKLDTSEMQLILDLHNWYRAQVSRGDVFQQPEAADMTVVEWDDRLADIAQFLAQSCRYDSKISSSPVDRPLSFLKNDIFGPLALNEFFTNSSQISYKTAIYSWFKGYGNFSFKNGTCNGLTCQQYQNMIYSNTFVIGCQYHQCVTGQSFICVYANSKENSLKKHLYKTGLSCTSCPQDFSYCMDGSLCASKFHCQDSKISKTCRCLVIPKLCFEHGDFDSFKCRCRCQPGWTGLNCEKTCKDKRTMCSKRIFACKEPLHKAVMSESCPETCKWCQNNPNSLPIFNRNSLKINTIYDPTTFSFDLQADTLCKDTKIECAAWASKGFCNTESVKRVCPVTCKVCAERTKTTESSQSCTDHPTCVSDFEPYCNIMTQVSIKCPKLCGGCKTSAGTSATLSTLSPTFSSTTNEIDNKIKSNKIEFTGACFETEYRKVTCESILQANLCSRPDLMEHCPITCKLPECQKPPSTSSTRSTTTTQMMTTIAEESKVCKFLPCNEPGVPEFCVKKCSGFSPPVRVLGNDNPPYCELYPCSIALVNEMCSKCFDPDICMSLDCNFNGVSKLCKRKCEPKNSNRTSKTSSFQTAMTSIPGTLSSLIYSTEISDSSICNWLPCVSPNILRICPRKCDLTSTSSTISTKKSTDSSFCNYLPCNVPQVKALCPMKCKATPVPSSTSTVPSSTQMSSSPSKKSSARSFMFKATSDLKFCEYISCSLPQAELACPMKCGAFSTPETTKQKSTDSPLCQWVECGLAHSSLACPRKCGLGTTTTSMESTKKMSTMPADPPFCHESLCSVPQFRSICQNKCGTTTLSSTFSTIKMDPIICMNLPCSYLEIRLLCPNKCASTTLVTSSTISSISTDHPLCPLIPCTNSKMPLVCPNKCGTSTRMTTTTESTKSADPDECAALPCSISFAAILCPNKCTSNTPELTTTTPVTNKPTDHPFCVAWPCSLPGISTWCPNKCLQTTTASTISSTTKQLDPPFCENFPCEYPLVKQACPNKCGIMFSERSTKMTEMSTTSASSTMTTDEGKTDFSICAIMVCDSEDAKQVCPIKCGSTTLKPTTLSSPSEPNVFTSIATDNPICDQLPCSNAGVQALCKIKCADNPICNSLPCSNPGVRMMCTRKCAAYVTVETSSTDIASTLSSTTTVERKESTEPFYCKVLPCSLPEVKNGCRKTCGSTTAAYSRLQSYLQ